MSIKKILKSNIRLYVAMAIIIILGVIGVTFALTFGSFNAIAINTTASVIEANITYDEGTNSSEIISNGKLLPIDDSLVTGPNIVNDRVLNVKFNVVGSSTNPDSTIYDIALYVNEIDCELRTEEVKWRLYRDDTLISEGSLSPTFDTMANNRLVLTNTQEDLNVTEKKYTFLMWISESCTGEITTCDPIEEQNQYLDKIIDASIKVELSTKSKKTISRITGDENSCYFSEVTVPVCNSLVYNANSQILIGESLEGGGGGYTLKNNSGIIASDYAVTLQLEDGYKWTDGSTNDKVLSCSIDKMKASITSFDQTITYGESIATGIDQVVISSLVDGHSLSAISLATNLASVGTGKITPSNAKILDADGGDVTDNYNITYNSGNVIIECLKLATMPTVSDQVYTGNELTGITGGEYIQIKGDKSATEIGCYNATVTPNANYCWESGTNEAMAVSWCVLNDAIMITLDNQEASMPGTTAIYIKNSNICLDDMCNFVMTASTNGIEAPAKVGYTFNGYYNSITSGRQLIGANGYALASFLDAVSGGTYPGYTTLYARWVANRYTIVYNANGGSGAPGSQTKTHGTTLTLSSTVPTKTGYRFLGWSTSSSATSATYQAGGSYTVNAGATLYAVWQEDSIPTCTLSVTTSGITMASKSSNVTAYGMSTSSTPVYNSTKSLSLSTGTKYGYVKTSTGKTGSCSVTISSTTSTKKTASINCTASNYNTRTTTACSAAGYTGYNGSNSCAPLYKGTTYTCTKNKTYVRCACTNDIDGLLIVGGNITQAQCPAACANNGSTYSEEHSYNITYSWEVATTFDGLDSRYCTTWNVSTCDADYFTTYTEAQRDTYRKRDCTLSSYSGTISCYNTTYTCSSGTKLNDSYCYK